MAARQKGLLQWAFREQTPGARVGENVSDRAKRAIETCRSIAGMSEEAGGTTRRFLTPPVGDVHRLLESRMKALGMTAHIDAAGNLRGLWKPEGERRGRVLIGSHIDTVPNAGAFDGVLGVVLALELVEVAKTNCLPLGLEVVAFSEEEGVRFGIPFIGSRAVAGRFDLSILERKDAQGTTVRQAIENFGLDPSRIADAVADPATAGYFEIHIEQGPVLEAENLSVAAVTSIVGQSRFELAFTGHANHAGTTPMHLRRDALAAAAEWIGRVESLARKTDGLVATVGKMSVLPNAGNVIAGRVELSLDVRHVDDRVRRSAQDELLEGAEAIASAEELAV